MGLDNGFIVTGLTLADIPSFVKLPFQTDYKNSIEIAYWRKCWGIRNVIFDKIHTVNQGLAKIDAEDISVVIKILKHFCSKEIWEEEADSIWEFEEIFEFSLLQQMLNLLWLQSYMKEHPEVECYFYDSY